LLSGITVTFPTPKDLQRLKAERAVLNKGGDESLSDFKDVSAEHGIDLPA
jgi:hypothetical protein